MAIDDNTTNTDALADKLVTNKLALSITPTTSGKVTERDLETDAKYNVSTDETTNPLATDKEGYIQYTSETSFAVDAPDDVWYGSNELFTINAGVMGGAFDDGNGGCNISFDAFFNIDWNLPEFDFFDAQPGAFDTSLFDKADQISLEMAMINDMLINAILDMNCCDIARVYNITMVPFFRFFADNPSITECGETAKPGDKCAWGGGQNLISMLILYAEVITMLRTIVEPLDCLVKPLPGNPWVEKDVDPLSWIYGYFKEAKPVLDKFLSGELLDIILNPIHNLRVKLQACLATGGQEGSDLFNIFEVGSPSQLQAISEAAVKDGKTIEDVSIPKPEEPKPPKSEDYPQGEDDPRYIEALEAYEKAKKKYDIDIEKYNGLKEEIARQSEAQKNVNPAAIERAQTKALLKVHTDGICGCVASALGLNDISLIPFPIKTSKDIGRLQGKTIHGVTNGDAGVQSKDRPKDEKFTMQPGDEKKESVKKAVVNSGEPKGNATKTELKEDSVKMNNPYKEIIPSEEDKFEVVIDAVEITDSNSSPKERLKDNDEKEKQIKDLTYKITNSGSKVEALQKEAEISWSKWRNKAKDLLNSQTTTLNILSNIDKNDENYELYRTYKLYLEDTLAEAREIYESYFRVFLPFDFNNDPYDQAAIGKFFPDTEAPYGISKKTNREKVVSLVLESNNIPTSQLEFTPLTPPQYVVNKLPLSTHVDVDERFEVNYFNAGFVREKGSPSWRNFNPLDLEWDEYTKKLGAIGPDRTDMYYRAIFPNDEIGLNASKTYIKEKFKDNTIEAIAINFLKKKNPANVDLFFSDLYEKYFISKTSKIEEISDDQLTSLIEEIKLNNGYVEGKLWVKMRKVSPDLTFNATTEINYVYENNRLKEIHTSDKILTIENSIFEPLFTAGDINTQMAELVNESLKERGSIYKEAVSEEKKKQEAGTARNEILDSLLNSIASVVNAEYDLLIPCTCDNFLCQLLNQIIQYALAALNKLIQEIINSIMKFLIPDWIKDLFKLIQDMLACFNELFGMIATVMQIHQYAEDLLESLKWRISLYPADPCFLPSAPFEESSSGSGFDWISDSGSGWQSDSGDGFPEFSFSGSGLIPPGPNRPPVHPGNGAPVPGYRGPGFEFYCEYILI